MMKVSGITGAGPLFAKIMLQLYSKKEYPGKFITPEGIHKVYICPLSGQKPHQYCPTRIEEYITTGDLAEYQKQLCEMHIKENNGISTAVPVKYADWANQLGVKTIQHPKSQPIFEIQNPKNGAVYQRLPNLTPEFQSIHIQLLSSEKFKKVKWYLNEQIIRTTSENHSFLWSAKPGHFQLRAVPVGQENTSATVSFEVK